MAACTAPPGALKKRRAGEPPRPSSASLSAMLVSVAALYAVSDSARRSFAAALSRKRGSTAKPPRARSGEERSGSTVATLMSVGRRAEVRRPRKRDRFEERGDTLVECCERQIAAALRRAESAFERGGRRGNRKTRSHGRPDIESEAGEV